MVLWWHGIQVTPSFPHVNQQMGFWNCDMTFISVLILGKVRSPACLGRARGERERRSVCLADKLLGMQAVLPDGSGASGAHIQVVGISYSGGADASALPDGTFTVLGMFDSDIKIEASREGGSGDAVSQGVSPAFKTIEHSGETMEIAPMQLT